MKRKIVTALMIFISPLSYGSELARQTDSIAEKRVFLAWNLTFPAIYTCLATADACQLDPEEGALLLEIYEKNAGADPAKIVQFKSAEKNPGFFDLKSGSHRIAVTGSGQGSQIYFNSDIIEPQAAELSIPSMISIFVHELGHHAGLKDDKEHYLDRLGNKVARVAERHLERTTGEGRKNKDIEILVFNQLPSPADVPDWSVARFYSFALAYISDGKKIFSFSETLPYLIDCFYGAEVRHLWLTDLVWANETTLTASEFHYCLATNKKRIDARAFLRFELDGASRLQGPPDLQIANIPAIEIESDWTQRQFLTWTQKQSLLRPLRVTASATQVKAGEKWKISVEAIGATDLKDCSLLISSDDFSLTYASGQKYSFTSKECTKKNLGGGKFRVEASYTFPEDSPERTYYVKAISLENKFELSETAWIIPTERQTVFVSSEKKAQVNELPSVLKTRFRDQIGSFPGAGMIDYEICHRFDLQFRLPGEAGINQAHLKYTLHFLDELSPLTYEERLTNKGTWKNWVDGSKEKEGGSRLHYFNLYIFEEFALPEKNNKIEFRELSLLTTDLEEYTVTFPRDAFGLKASWGWNRSCDKNNYPTDITEIP